MRLLLRVLLLSIIATTAMAQSRDQVATMSCQNAAAKEVRAQRLEADSIRFNPNPLVTEKSRHEAGVHGAGQYLDKSRREWRPFMYNCAYRPGSAKTRITVQFDSSSGTN